MSSKNFMSYEDATTVLGSYANTIKNKQDSLTAGQYIQMQGNEISVKRDISKVDTAVNYVCNTVGIGSFAIKKYVNGEQVGSTIQYEYNTIVGTQNIDDVFTVAYTATSADWIITNTVASNEHPAGYEKKMFRSLPAEYSQTFVVVLDADKKLIIQSELETALAGKQDTLTFDDVPTANSNNPVKSGGVKSAIDSAVSRCYHHAGTKTVAQLTHDLLISANEGNVYEITDSGTTTSDFMEGIGRPIKEGDNVGIAKISDGVYKFDLLSGFVDTTNFVQKSQTSGLLNNDGTVNTTIECDVDELTDDVSDIKSKIDDATVYPYADAITIEDAVPSNLADCSVKIEPVQDLHGYDKPWVGGAGKNLMPNPLNNGVVGSNGSYSSRDDRITNVTKSFDNILPIKAGTYTISADGLDGCTVLTKDASDNIVDNFANSWNNLPYTFTLTADAFLYVSLRKNNNDNISPNDYQVQVESGSTATSYEPYENICPISGHTEVDVQRDGKNMFPSDIAIYNGYYNDEGTIVASDRTGHSNLFMCKSNTSYICTISATNPQIIGANGKWGIYCWDANKSFISKSTCTFESTQFNVTTPQNCKYMSLQLPINKSATDVGFNIALSQLEEGTTPTDFVPYAGKTYTIALGDTIYGGTVDFDSGVLSSYGDIKNEDNFAWGGSGTSAGGLHYVDCSVSAVSNVGISNMLPKEDSAWDKTYPCVNIYASRIRVYGNFTSLDEFKEQFSGLQIYYQKATPTTIQLTPQQIQLLKGTNTLTASTGQISVTVNGVSGSIGQVQEQVNNIASDKQDKTDNSLNTTAKTIVGSINELSNNLTNVANQIVGVKAGLLSSGTGDTVYIPAKVYPRVLIVLNNQGSDGTNGRPAIVGILNMGISGTYKFEQITNITDYALSFTYDDTTDPNNPRFAVQYIKVSDSTTHTYLRGFYLTADLRWRI